MCKAAIPSSQRVLSYAQDRNARTKSARERKAELPLLHGLPTRSGCHRWAYSMLIKLYLLMLSGEIGRSGSPLVIPISTQTKAGRESTDSATEAVRRALQHSRDPVKVQRNIPHPTTPCQNHPMQNPNTTRNPSAPIA